MGRVLQGLRIADAQLRSGAQSSRKEPSLWAWFFWCSLLVGFGASAQTAPKIFLPAGMAYDANGNLFLADASGHQVLEVSVGGALSVVAGSGVQGFGGDGSLAVSALLNEPESVAMGADGTLFIADAGNRRIRAVSKGVITTIVGTGARGNGGDGGSASAATLDRPTALAVTASGGLLICDTGNHRVRLLSNGLMQAFAGLGTQGFAGDGGAAASALLDSPEGVAVMPDGRVVIADSHNHRLRIVGTDGVIQTLAGTGARGYSGDGGPATSAMLFLPRGLSATTSGGVIFADSNNQRVRMVDAGGKISTLAGNGVQGSAEDSTSANDAPLNVPNGVAVSPYGAAALGDLSSQALRAVAANGKIYLVPAPVSRVSAVVLSFAPNAIYGQAAATVAVNASVTPQGRVELDEVGTVVGAGVLNGGQSSVSLGTLTAGSHNLVARYAGDGVNPAATSASVSLLVSPASATATASSVSVAYGEPVPPLSGSVTGILPQDAANVSVTYSTAATPLIGVGSYPIDVSLTGSASPNYTLNKAASSGSLTVHQAASTTAMQTTSQASYAGLPLQLTASVSPQFAGAATGEVDFVENGSVVARGPAKNGSASASYLNPSAGSHVITASYLGDANFLGSSSTSQNVSVSAMPDFTLAPASSSQSVQAGLSASFQLSVNSQGVPFTGSVSFSVSGVPTGAQASFLPVAVVPGSAGASTTLNIQTPAVRADARSTDRSRGFALLALAPLLVLLRRRKLNVLGILMCAIVGLGAVGCGARTVGGTSASASQSYPLQVTATSTNLAGAVVIHTATVTLIVH